jgi:hypothetical protein
MSVQEKREKIIKSIEHLSSNEIDLIEAFLVKISQESNMQHDVEKLYAEVKARYGNVLAKLAQ